MSILQPQGQAPVAVAVGAFAARQFLASDFQPTPNPFTASNPVKVAEYSVPLNMMASLLPGRRAEMYFKAKFTTIFAATVAQTDVNINLGTAGYDVVQSKRPLPAIPVGGILGYPDVHAIAVVGGVRQEALLMSINYATNVAVVRVPTNTTQIDLYYLTGDGEVVLRAVRPTGSDQANPQLFRYSFRSLHETDQKNDRTAITLDSLKELPPRWKLRIEVTSPTSIDFSADSRQRLFLPGGLTPVKVLDGSRFDALAEISLRNGRL